MSEEKISVLKDILSTPLYGQFKMQDAALVSLGSYLGYRIYKYSQWKIKNARCEDLATKTLERRNRNWQSFDTKNIDVDLILRLDVCQLREELFKGTFSSVDLVTVFAERCQRIGRALNLSTEENFTQALGMAMKKDQELAKAKKEGRENELGLMFGIPFSVKDLLKQKGFLSTVGCAFLCDDFSTEDSVVVKQYLKAGGIPIVRGNVPQSALSIHTDNLVFGEAKNPLKQDRSTGGSSGGDAGLIAARCVPLGVGSDIGGSLRFPASFCGIYGFKPTQSRFTRKGHAPARRLRFSSFQHLYATSGPMGSSVDDLVVGIKIQSDPEVHKDDPFTTPFPWKENNFQSVQGSTNARKTKVAVLQESSFLPCTDSVKRAIKLTEKALRDLGYQVVPFSFDDKIWRECTDLFFQLVCNGSTPGLIRDFTEECETWMTPLKNTFMLFSCSWFKRMFVDFALKYIKNSGRLCRQIKHLRLLNPQKFEAQIKRRYEFAHEFAQMWQKEEFDALICPIWPSSAPLAKNTADMGLFLEYSLMWNVTGFPCGTMPVTKVLAKEQQHSDSYNDAWTKLIDQDTKNSVDMPVSVQVVGYAFEDEKVLGIMKQLQQKLGYQIEMPPKRLANIAQK